MRKKEKKKKERAKGRAVRLLKIKKMMKKEYDRARYSQKKTTKVNLIKSRKTIENEHPHIKNPRRERKKRLNSTLKMVMGG